MGPSEKKRDASRGRKGSRGKSKQKTKPRVRTGQTASPATPGFQRLDDTKIKKVPSNAPTMAIAPSDYEHIYHEGQGGVGAAGNPQNVQEPPPLPPPPPPAAYITPPPRMGVGGGQRPLGYMAGGAASPRPHFAGGPSPPTYGAGNYDVAAQQAPQPLMDGPLQVTMDGYTLIGANPDESNNGHIPLPPHIVRASNQFSRAALARIANYLATRAER